MRLSLLLYFLLILPISREVLESYMVTHMFVQLPLLYAVGMLFPNRKEYKTRHIWSNIIFVLGLLSFWMVPRTLDDALVNTYTEILKFISLPLIGYLWKVSWRHLSEMTLAFIYTQLVSMCGLFAWLYLDTPIQICNNYLINEQKIVGAIYLVITIFMCGYLLKIAFIGNKKT
ncbi:hypothetical protein ACFOZ1_03750 [Gracilibacillus marinus]|jgi:hypothetical protein|uniref:Uncharacterized protein n=1 Tax=Gracilibacillus marinus TaxID=630535 RepID=A0ABV8VRU6_9BACI